MRPLLVPPACEQFALTRAGEGLLRRARRKNWQSPPRRPRGLAAPRRVVFDHGLVDLRPVLDTVSDEMTRQAADLGQSHVDGGSGAVLFGEHCALERTDGGPQRLGHGLHASFPPTGREPLRLVGR